MPSKYFSAIEQESNTLYLILGFMALCFCFVGLYFYVQKPKKGTIEWIRSYDTGRFEAFTYEPLTYKDILCWLLTFVVTLFLCSLRFVIHYKLGLLMPFTADVWHLVITGAIATLSLSISFYGFFRLFYTSRFVAFLVTCISCSLFSREMYSVILLLFSWIFLYLWICNNSRKYKRIQPLYFILAFVFYGFTLMSCWATFYLFPIYIGGVITGKVSQWHRGDLERKKGRFIFSLFLLTITSAVIFLVLWLLYYAFKNENMNLLTIAISGEAYDSLIPTFLEKMSAITFPESNQGRIAVTVVQQDLFRPVLFITSMIPTVYSGIFKRKSQALTAVICAILFLIIWIVAGVDIMCPGAMLSIGWMFKGFRDRGYKIYGVLISIALLAFYFASLIL